MWIEYRYSPNCIIEGEVFTNKEGETKVSKLEVFVDIEGIEYQIDRAMTEAELRRFSEAIRIHAFEQYGKELKRFREPDFEVDL